MKFRLRSFLTVVFGLLAAARLSACPIPVYQYALEHWESDPYEVSVTVGAGALSGEQREALTMLQGAADGPAGLRANLRLTVVAGGGDATDPQTVRLVVRYPGISGISRPLWTGELTLDNVRALLSSPLRKQLGEALLRRSSAVWLLLESGDRRVDRELETLVTRQLRRLEKELLVPETAEWGGQEVNIDHKVNFTLLRVSRDDPAERMLVRMLLASEADLETDFAGQPMVFPIYGRGLILYALVGQGVNAWTIGEAANFLTGPCSCQIKAANPGTDLLTDVDWAGRIKALTPATVGETVGTGAFLQRLDEADARPEE